ncbi:hypothetical protein E2C01_002194 [Portunus trituberculatus]|uniref:Uncharacterized protein n=1 Tax=Portunus trituberculatus TaxID=210409 RepID=A0A5B7CJR4_PORTR|nr:hypothetical protein [Portunus trituberculatus]
MNKTDAAFPHQLILAVLDLVEQSRQSAWCTGISSYYPPPPPTSPATHRHILILAQVKETIECLILKVGEVPEEPCDELGCEAPLPRPSLHPTQDLQELCLMLGTQDTLTPSYYRTTVHRTTTMSSSPPRYHTRHHNCVHSTSLSHCTTVHRITTPLNHCPPHHSAPPQPYHNSTATLFTSHNTLQ